MKHTAATFFIATLAIAGIPPLSGFWSKDEILVAAYNSGNMIAFGILLLCAFMTSFYMFRLVFLTFFGKPRNHHIHAHESPASMTGPLWVLAIGAIVVGIPGSPWMNHWFSNFIEHGASILGNSAHHGEHVEHAINWFVVGCSVAVGFGGMILAGIFYLGGRNLGQSVAKTFQPLYQLSINKFWVDELYNTLIIKPFQAIGGFFFQFDQRIVDGTVNGAGLFTIWASSVKLWIDKNIVDGLVNLTGYLTIFLSAIFRRIQTGFIQHYLLIVFIGVLVLIVLELRP